MKLSKKNEGDNDSDRNAVSRYRLGDFVDFFIASCFVHYRKPDADIYCIALDIAQAKPEELAYLDDRPLFVEVAQGLGINGIVHTDCGSSERQLANLGLAL